MMQSMFAHSFSFLAAEKSIYRSICIRNVRKKNIYLIYLSSLLMVPRWYQGRVSQTLLKTVFGLLIII